MAEHYKVPSFDGQTINAQVGKTITLTDTNNVLSNFDISVSGAEYSINGNTLTIKPTTDGAININLTKKMHYEQGYKIFYKDGVQNMLVAGSVDPVRSLVRIKSYYTAVKVNKIDSEKLEDDKFVVYYLFNNKEISQYKRYKFDKYAGNFLSETAIPFPPLNLLLPAFAPEIPLIPALFLLAFPPIYLSA